jgi:hypothetical protein
MFKRAPPPRPLLAWIGAAMLLTLIVCALLSIGDNRLILGINPWIKPMKFPRLGHDLPVDRRLVHARHVARRATKKCCAMDDRPGDDHRDGLHHHAGGTGHDLALQHRDAIRWVGVQHHGMTILVNTIAMIVFLAIIRRDTPPNEPVTSGAFALAC